MTNKLLRILFSLPIAILLLGICLVNVRVYHSPQIQVKGNDTINYELLKELRGLKLSLQKNADVDMQKIYPEGYLFLNALYGLAWCNFLADKNNKLTQAYFNEGHTEIQNAYKKIDSSIGRSPFQEELPLPYGAFYTGWSTYLLGKKLSIEPVKDRDSAEVQYFKNQCKQIAASVKEKVYPVSYYGVAWPADAVVCIAALSLYDNLFPEKYSNSINNWLERVKKTLDHNGLIPHAVNPANGKSTETARGSSQSLMLIFLKDIDTTFSQNQFKIYKAKFLDTKFGITGIREYPKNEYGIGDVDSGPVIFQLGSAATIVGMKTMHLYRNERVSILIRNVINGVGFPLQANERKTYLFGLLPMADAFIAWGNDLKNKESEVEFISFHLCSALIVLILSAILWLLFKPKKPSSATLSIPW